MATIIVFVHGWSVTNTNTYGGLPERLAREGAKHGKPVSIKHVFLGKYISFHDEVRVKDIARAFEHAVHDHGLDSGDRFVCITHSTGGPVVREWWHRYYYNPGTPTCPMSHLIMLAPANYGSALAVLGKGRLSRLKSWWQGVEPGQGVLDWLAVGSNEAWELNRDWITTGDKHIGANGVFPFVITGQSIDRKVYDNLNTYTGELGSDGVVRVAAANLRGNYVRLEQESPKRNPKAKKKAEHYHAPTLAYDGKASAHAASTALLVVAGKSHSGSAMGIMRSVKAKVGSKKDQQTVDAIFECMNVASKTTYNSLVKQFDKATATTQKNELLEIEDNWLRMDTYFIHDRFSQVIFRVTDHEGFPVTDFELVLTAGDDNDPNHLPRGFFADRQGNAKTGNTVTYYLNHSVMTGCEEITDPRNGDLVRSQRPGIEKLGLQVRARPDEGFARYMPCHIAASTDLLAAVLQPNATTMIDIVLRRVVAEETFALDKGTQKRDFTKTKPGKPLMD